MGKLKTKTSLRYLSIAVLVIVILGTGLGSLFTQKAYGAELSARSLELSDSQAGTHNVTYNVSFTLSTPGALGSIVIEFCSNSTFITDPCDAPYGLDVLNSAITTESGVSGFGKSTASTVNEFVLSRPSTVSGAVPVNMAFDQVVNPTDNGSYYVRVLTYASSDASGPVTDSGGMAFVIQNAIAVGVSTEIPPYLTFCVADVIPSFDHDCSGESGDYIDLGNFDTGHTSSGTTQFMTATNAQSGYSVYVQGDTLTSGNNVIPALTTDTASQVGVSQFGINLRANTNPTVGTEASGPGFGTASSGYGKINAYQYNSGDVVASSANADDFRRYTVSYIVNINKSQPVGIYASTFTYICLANF